MPVLKEPHEAAGRGVLVGSSIELGEERRKRGREPFEPRPREQVGLNAKPGKLGTLALRSKLGHPESNVVLQVCTLHKEVAAPNALEWITIDRS